MMASTLTVQADGEDGGFVAGGERFGIVLAVAVAASAAFNTTLNGDILLLVGAVVTFSLKSRRLVPLLFVVMLASTLWQNPVWWEDTRVGVMAGVCVALAAVGALRAGAAAFKAEEKEKQARFALWSLLFTVSAFFGLAALLLSRIFGLPLHKEIFALFLTAAFAPVIFVFSRWISAPLGAGLALFVSLCGFTQLALQFTQIRTATPETLKMLLKRGKTNGLRRAALVELLRERLAREDAYGAAQLLSRHTGLLHETEETKIRWNLAIRLANEARSRKDMKLLDVALRIAPDCTPVLVEQMKNLIKHGDLSGAERLAQRILTVNPLCCDAVVLLIRRALKKGESDNAADLAIKYGMPAEITEKQRLVLAPRIAEKGRWNLIAGMLKNAQTQEGMLWLFAALSKLNNPKAAKTADTIRKKFPQLAKDVDWLGKSPLPKPAEIKKHFPEANILLKEVTSGLRLLGFACPAKVRQLEEFELKLVLQKTLPIKSVDLMIFLGKLPIYRRLVRLNKRHCGEMFCERLTLRVPYSLQMGTHNLCVCRFVKKHNGKCWNYDESRLRFVEIRKMTVEQAKLPRLSEEERRKLLSQLPEGKNLLVNGSFEQPLSVGWKVHRPSPNFRFFRDPNMAVEGKHSLCVDTWDLRHSFWHISQAFTVEGGKEYVVTAVYHASGFRNCHFALLVRDAERSWRVLSRSVRLAPSRNWALTRLQFSAPEKTRKVRLYVYRFASKKLYGREDVSCSGTVWIDSIRVVKRSWESPNE
ncbi:MAG: hypothetical protein DRP82_00025 [Planctomycetota bacterium]|nr:MAG: hypothetical protein DRP82_00025 [Planctomycetota bacterium]